MVGLVVLKIHIYWGTEERRWAHNLSAEGTQEVRLRSAEGLLCEPPALNLGFPSAVKKSSTFTI